MDNHPTRSSQPHTRRSLLHKTAWSVPAVAVAAAAPAVAASAGGTITNSIFDISPDAYEVGGPTRLNGFLQFANSGVPPVTISLINLTVAFPAARVPDDDPVLGGAGWVYAGTVVAGLSRLFIFSWGGSLPPLGSTSMLEFYVPLSDNSPGTFTTTATATPLGGNSVSVSTTDTI